MKKNKIFEGVATALITPMRDGAIDYAALDGIIEAQILAKVDALVIGGTTGEAATLTDRERYKLYSYTRERTKGRTKLVFGTGTNDTATAIAHTKAAAKIGCDGILAVTPYYNKGTHRGVTEHYKRIAAASDLPTILYNVPSRTGVNLTIPQLEELARVEGIVGIKEASDSADRLTELAAFGDELYTYAGNDSQIYITLALGGAGVISVVSNLYPERIRAICTRYAEGNARAALDGQLSLLDFIKLMFRETNPAPIKYAMSLAGLCTGELRLPLYEIGDGLKDEIKEMMRQL